MVKHRLMGTKKELIMRIRRLEKDATVELLSVSSFYPIKGSSKYYRIYIEEEHRKET